MFARKPRTEIVIRIVVIATILFNAFAPVTALAQKESKPSDASLVTSQSLPEQVPAYFVPPTTVEPERRTPDPDKPKSPIPPKDTVGFSMVATPAIVPANGVLEFAVFIRNNSDQEISGLTFVDMLETGLDYKPDASSPVDFNPATREVRLNIDGLQTGEEYRFSYSVIVTSSQRSQLQGKIWLHDAELDSSDNSLQLETNAAFGLALAGTTPDSQFSTLRLNGGWNALGRVTIYMEKDNVGRDALVLSTPARIPGRGPALQFSLDVYETSPLISDSNGRFHEQNISLSREFNGAFKAPAFLEINLDGYVDLQNVPAGQEPYVATYDETNQIWIKVPILESDHLRNTVTVEAAHFSTWGAGLGSSLPQNGANVLLFDQPYTSLFTGSSRYSIPVWAPPGRTAMQPDISLSYSSGTVDGVLGDVQAPWVGVGWNMDAVEIVRKITTDENGYGYRNEFALTLNGSLYQLVRDTDHQNRYYTDQAAFLYVERHNYSFGNNPSIVNKTGEWWEVATTDGTRYRLGWTNDSEQLALMYGYACTSNGLNCITPDGAYASLGYAGKARDLVAMRWRVDRVTDAHGNYMEYAYEETPPATSTTIPQFDRESYLKSISYTGFQDPAGIAASVAPAYEIKFSTVSRSSVGDVPTEFNIWDNIDSKRLDKIQTCYGKCDSGGTIVRTYQFGYSLASVPNSNGTLTLTSLKITSGGYTENGQVIPSTTAPTIQFTYQNLPNRAIGNGDVFTYPRLDKIDNGSGGLLTFTYENDNRANNSWLNYRVQNVVVNSGIGTEIAKKQGYTYTTPVYSGQGGDPNLGSLIGYTNVTESVLDFANADAHILDTKHTFGTAGLDIGRELQTEWISGTTVLRKSTSVYVTDNSRAPFFGWNYRYLAESASYERSGGVLSLTSRNTYYHDPSTGNLVTQSTYLGSSLYRKTYYEYLANPDPKYYIMDKATRVLLVGPSNQIYSDTRYHYDGMINQAPIRGDVTLVQRFTGNGNQTADSSTNYDIYGNAISGRAYRSYGAANIAPTAPYWESSTTYDATLHTFPVTSINALGNSTTSNYLYTLGVPYQVADPNTWVTKTTYDGLGRTLSVTPPGLNQPGTWYIYPVPNASTGQIPARHSVEMQILDTIAGRYRSVWGIYDGAGRMIQTQVDAGNQLLVNTTQFNSQGLANQQSLPYYVAAPGGTFTSVAANQYTTTQYDALGRATQVTAPGNIVSQTVYDGLTTTSIDPNTNKVVRTTDGLGRMIMVTEYSDPSTVYAVTKYDYDNADRLVQVTDAQSNVTTIQYDWLGRKTGMDDADMGVWTYGYDSLGNMTSQVDARNHQLTFTYDGLNRLLTKNDDDASTPVTTYTYGTTVGTIGLRTNMSDASGSTAWSYANYGRTVTENRTISSETHSVISTSDWLGRAIATTYDDNEVVSYTYDELGRPDQLKSGSTTLVDLAYNTLGQIYTQTLGNGTVVTNTYDYNPDNNSGTIRLTNRKAVKAGATQLNLTYSYDSNGNIINLIDGTANETSFYHYDSLNRLTSAIGAVGISTAMPEPATPQTYGQQFGYDKVGNILQVNNWGTPPPTQMGYQDSQGQFRFMSYKRPEAVYQSSSVTFLPTADAYIQSGSPDTNTGTATTVQTDNSPIKHFLLKFDVTGITGQQISNVKLRLYNKDASSKGGDFYSVSDNSWQESTITWNNAPAAETTLLASLGSVTTNNWYEVDLSSLVNADGTYSLRVSSTSTDGADYSSKEGSNPPQLVVTFAGATNTPSPTFTDTLTPTSTFTPTVANTNTPTPTFTASATPSNTPTPTVSNTPTIVPTNTSNATSTATFTATLSPTPTVAATAVSFWPERTWTFDTTVEGWGNPSVNISGFGWQTDGYVGGSINGADPFIYSPDNLGLDTGLNKIIKIRFKNTTPSTFAQLFFITNSDATWNEAKHKDFTVTANSDYTEYTVDMSSVTGWTGTLRQLRFDPGNAAGSFSLDYLKIGTTNSAAQSLAARWNFEGVAGTTVPDVADSDNPATLQTGAMIIPNGANGSGVSFDGTSNWMTVPNHADLVKNGSFTLSAWINPSAVITDRTQYIINKGVSATDFDYGFITTSVVGSGTATPTPPANIDIDGKLVFRVGDLTPNKVVGPVLPTNTWTLVTGVYDSSAGELRLYINGVLASVERVTGTISMGAGALNFSPANNYYQGKLDDVRFYNRALTDQEVTNQLLGAFATPTPLPTATATITFTPIATSLSASAQKWGTGSDGSITINAGETYNISSSASKITGRACVDAPAYGVASLGSTTAYLSSSPASGCLKAGDEIMLINVQGSAESTYNTGVYEFLRVASVSGSSVLFTTMKSNWYGNGFHSDLNIGTGAGQQRVMLIRVPNYQNVTVNGTLTISAWNGSQNGLLAMRVSGTLSGNGIISANTAGFRGGINPYYNGEGYTGFPGLGGGIQGLPAVQCNNGMGGGGAYGTNGTSAGAKGGAGGIAYGSSDLSTLFYGSAGGAAGIIRGQNGDPDQDGAPGRAGGGIMWIAGHTINFSGTVSSNGGSGTDRGGSGAGGAIRIEGYNVTLNVLNALGGTTYDGCWGLVTTGGTGRIAVYYQNSYSMASVNPTAYIGMLAQETTPTVTPTATSISLVPLNVYGNGADGDLTINSAATFNIHTNTQNPLRSCVQGGEAISFAVTSLTSSSAMLSTAPASNCLKADDELLLINMEGTSTNFANTGKYEFLRVGGIVGNTVYFKTPKVNYYGANAGDDSGISQQHVMLMRVPNYNNVIVNGTLTGSPWNGSGNGLVVFRVKGTLSGSGVISANGLGYRGGVNPYYNGEGYTGFPGAGGGVQGLPAIACSNGMGGGGAYATNGTTAGTGGGAGGIAYGTAELSPYLFGAGGGAAGIIRGQNGNPDQDGAPGRPGGGGIFISGQTISFSGAISSIGLNGVDRSGSGAGGAIRIEGNTITLGGLNISGGTTYDNCWTPVYTYGGIGRVAIYYANSFTNSATVCAQASTYCQNTSLVATPTVVPSNPGTNGLVSWWTMDETSGTRSDSYGTNHLTDNNTVAYSAGLKGNAASFVSANLEYLSIPDNPSISAGDFDFTVITNVYFTSLANSVVVLKKGLKNSPQISDYQIFYSSGNGKLSFRVGNGTIFADATSNASISTGQWYTVIAWHDSVNNTINIQVNNSSVDSVGYSAGAIDSTYPLSIGAHSDGTVGLDGRIDDVTLYRRLLTAGERAWLYNSGASRTYTDVNPPSSNPGTSGLAAWWSLNETSGVRNDSHGNNHLTDNDTVGSANGLRSNAASFVPANLEYLSIADNAALSAGNIDFTLVANVYMNSTPGMMVIASKGQVGTNNRDYVLYYEPNSSKFYFSAGNATISGYVASQQTVTAGQWYTIVAWHDSVADTLNIQVNNGTVSTVSYSSGAMDSTYALTIGGYMNGSSIMEGRIDEVALYKRVLTAAERTWLYNNGSARTYTEASATATTWYSSNYTYSTVAPHAVTSVSHPNNTDWFTYDENGNMTCRLENGIVYKQTYNAENRISGIYKMSGSCATGEIQESWLYAYDGDGTRVSTAHFTGSTPDPITRYYFGGAVETTNNGMKKYYFFAGQTVAMKESGVFKYFLSDHLGSTSVVLNADGTIAQQQRYFPFGAPRTVSGFAMITSTDLTYTGQRIMSGTGLMDYKARFYSPYINHFIQPDTIIPNPANPQSWNRYSYVANSPTNYSDPSGHAQTCGDQYEQCGSTPPAPAVDYCDTHPNACGGGGNPENQLKKDQAIEEMELGDIITFDVMVDGEVVTRNYMMGILDDKTVGFWDLDSHTYVEYALAVNMMDAANAWTTFKKVDPKTFNSYEVMASSGTPANNPSFDVSWTGGMDDNPAYVEIRTAVDRENAPTAFAWAVLGPGIVSSFWMDAKPTITPLSQNGYYPLTNYIWAWSYLATDGVALERYPVIHP